MIKVESGKGVYPMLSAIKLKARIDADRRIELREPPPDLPEGEVELILLYEQEPSQEKGKAISPLDWPVLDGGRYLGGTVRRKKIYDDDGR
jgi:hypothetical protein